MAFDYFDDFDFDNSSQSFIDEMIFKGAEMGLSMGISQTATKDELRSRGFSFSNAKFSTLWNSISNESIGFKHFSDLNLDSLAIDDLLPEKDYFEARYRYIGRFDINDIEGAPPFWRTMAFDTDKRLTPVQVLAHLHDLAVSDYGGDGNELDTIEISGVLLNRNYEAFEE